MLRIRLHLVEERYNKIKKKNIFNITYWVRYPYPTIKCLTRTTVNKTSREREGNATQHNTTQHNMVTQLLNTFTHFHFHFYFSPKPASISISSLSSSLRRARANFHLYPRTRIAIACRASSMEEFSSSLDSLTQRFSTHNLQSQSQSQSQSQPQPQPPSLKKQQQQQLEHLNWDHSFVRELPPDPRTDSFPREVTSPSPHHFYFNPLFNKNQFFSLLYWI